MANNGRKFLSEYSRFLDDSGRHLTYAALSIYRNFQGELSEREKNFLQSHLDSCPACSSRLREVEVIEEEGTQKQPKRISGMTPVLFRYAAAAVLTVAVGMTIFFTMMKKPQEATTVKEILPDHSLASVEPDPAKLIPNQVLENFIERTLRSASDVSILSPGMGDTISMPFTFKWEGEKRGKGCTLTIVDNKNGEVWTKTTSASEVVLKNKLEPGLYYLKLEVNEKLVRVGKFFVIR